MSRSACWAARSPSRSSTASRASRRSKRSRVADSGASSRPRPSRRRGVGEPVHRRGLLPGDQVPASGHLAIAGVGVMVSDQAGVLVGPARGFGHLLEPPGRQPVVGLAMAPQHPFVGDVAQQGVLEQELARCRRTPRAPARTRAPARAAGRGRRWSARRSGRRLVAVDAQVLDGVVPEHPADTEARCSASRSSADSASRRACSTLRRVAGTRPSSSRSSSDLPAVVVAWRSTPASMSQLTSSST